MTETATDEVEAPVIENHAKVYLRRTAGGEWEVDPVTLDGYPLDGLDDGDELVDDPQGRPAHWPTIETDAETVSAFDKARADLDTKPLPDGRAIVALLAEALGYRLVPIETEATQ